VTVSTPIRIVALVGLLAALGMGAFVMLGTGHTSSPTAGSPTTGSPTTGSPTTGSPTTGNSTTPVAAATAAPTPVHTHHVRTPAAHHHRTTAGTAPVTIPATLTRALRKTPVVVAVLYAHGLPDEAGLISAAHEGAKAAHAGFVVLDVRGEKIAESVATFWPTASDPSILIVTRKHGLVTLLPGLQEPVAVTQAVADARG
jgi:hypothetical protein